MLTSQALSQLYGTEVDVVRHRGRIMVVGAPDEVAAPPHHEDLTDGAHA